MSIELQLYARSGIVKIFLSATKDRKLWIAMIFQILRRYGLQEKKRIFKINEFDIYEGSKEKKIQKSLINNKLN